MGRSRIARLLCVALAATAAVPLTAGAAVETWPATASDKVFPDTAKPATAEAVVSIAAARDEYEGAQIAIRSDQAITITPVVTDLTGPGTIPASAVEVFRVGYVQLTKPSTGVDALAGGGRYPDPLIPVRGSVTIPAGETTSIYVLVHVPAGAAAGVHEGTIDLGAAGQVPLKVDVAPVTANRTDYKVTARLSVLSLAEVLGTTQDDPAFIAGVYDSLIPMLAEHGVSPGRPPVTYPQIDGSWNMNWTGGASTRLDRFLAAPFAAIEVPFLPNYPDVGGEDRTYLKDAQRRAAAQSIAGRFGASAIARSYSLVIDEPRTDEYATVVRGARQLHSANPPIPAMVTEAPTKDAMKAMGADVDIWTPPIWDHYKDPAASRKVLASGKQLWWYTYGSDTQRFTPNVLIDKPTTEPRVLGWLAEGEGVQGFFYWGLNNWKDKISEGVQVVRSPNVDPWYLSHTKIDVECGDGKTKRAVGGNGEASLIWPGPSTSEPAYGSLRLEALRDGAEDYSILKALRAADPVFHDRVLAGLVSPYTGASDGQNACLDASRPGYLPVVETAPTAIESTRRAVLDRLSGRPLPTITGRVVFGGGKPGAKGKGMGVSGRGVPSAAVRFAGFETTTDRNGYWTLANVPNTPGTLRVSRDPVGKVDAIEVPVTTADLAAGTVTVPPLPAPDGRTVTGLGLMPFRATMAPASVRSAKGGVLTLRLANAYKPNGDSKYVAGGTTPSVEATYPRIAKTKAARDWRGYRYLDMTVEVLQEAAPGQRWYLIVTPGGHFANSRNLAIGRKVQHVRVDLRAAHPDKGKMKRMNDVRYIRFGLQSALPKVWRGGHTPTVRLKISDLQLVK